LNRGGIYLWCPLLVVGRRLVMFQLQTKSYLLLLMTFFIYIFVNNLYGNPLFDSDIK